MVCGEDRETVNGKPHLGLWFGKYIVVASGVWEGDSLKDPLWAAGVLLKKQVLSALPEQCEFRHGSVVIKPALWSSPLETKGTVGMKFMIWGRAYRVMRLLKKGKRRYAKKIVGGRMKMVRVDKRL